MFIPKFTDTPVELLRLCRVTLPAAAMDDLLKPTERGHWWRVDRGVPADARLVRWFIDHQTDELVAWYEHPTFEPCPPGQMPLLMSVSVKVFVEPSVFEV